MSDYIPITPDMIYCVPTFCRFMLVLFSVPSLRDNVQKLCDPLSLPFALIRSSGSRTKCSLLNPLTALCWYFSTFLHVPYTFSTFLRCPNTFSIFLHFTPSQHFYTFLTTIHLWIPCIIYICNAMYGMCVCKYERTYMCECIYVSVHTHIYTFNTCRFSATILWASRKLVVQSL